MTDEKIVFCRGGGCTAKLGSAALERILSKLPPPQDANLLIGTESCDDAAVYRLTDDLAAVQTLDFFPPMVEDPYTFGQIAAANALSDIYAMGGTVKTALNIVCFPETMHLNILGEILRGGSEKVTEAGGVLVGGHSIADSEVKYGLSVFGTIHPDKIRPNNGGQVGDKLLLTKPLGTGILCTAARVGMVSPAAWQAAIQSMTTLNRFAAETADSFADAIHACTDVTGFGLLGHLREMLREGISARVFFPEIPIFQEVLALADACCLTAAAQRNRNHLQPHLRLRGLSFAQEEVLFDPQTSGGLLFAVAPEYASVLQTALQAKGLLCGCIGELIPKMDVDIIVQN